MPLSLPTALAISAGAQALSAGGSAAIQNSGSKKSQKRAFKYNEQAAENAYARQLDYWNQINAYNAPSAELARIKEAGLSPGLYYSSVSPGSAATSASAPQGSGASGAIPHPSLGTGGALSSASQALALRSQESVINLNNANAGRANAEAGIVTDKQRYIQSQTELNSVLAQNTLARTVGQDLANSLAEQTLPTNVASANLNVASQEVMLERYITALERETIQYDIENATFDDRIESIRQDVKLKATGVAVNMVYASALRAGVTLTEEQVNSIRTAIKTEVEYTRPSIEAGTSVTQKRGEILSKEIDWFNPREVLNFIQTIARSVSYFK